MSAPLIFDLIKRLEVLEKLQVISDANDTSLNTGLYRMTDDTSNAPFSSAWTLEVHKLGDSNITQIAYRYRDSHIYMRNYNALAPSGWKDWSYVGNRNIITIGNNTNATLIKDTTTTIPMEATVLKQGTMLAKSGNNVKISYGVRKVLVSATAWIETSGYKWLMIFKNDIRVAHAMFPKGSSEVWGSVSISNYLIEVTEGDEISLRCLVSDSNGNTGGGTYGTPSTYLTVEVVD